MPAGPCSCTGPPTYMYMPQRRWQEPFPVRLQTVWCAASRAERPDVRCTTSLAHLHAPHILIPDSHYSCVRPHPLQQPASAVNTSSSVGTTQLTANNTGTIMHTLQAAQLVLTHAVSWSVVFPHAHQSRSSGLDSRIWQLTHCAGGLLHWPKHTAALPCLVLCETVRACSLGPDPQPRLSRGNAPHSAVASASGGAAGPGWASCFGAWAPMQ
jgi:hypothetical protein